MQVLREMERHWQKMYEQNYARSLDHRSFYFKSIDKRNLGNKQLVAELKEASDARRNSPAHCLLLHTSIPPALRLQPDLVYEMGQKCALAIPTCSHILRVHGYLRLNARVSMRLSYVYMLGALGAGLLFRAGKLRHAGKLLVGCWSVVSIIHHHPHIRPLSIQCTASRGAEGGQRCAPQLARALPAAPHLHPPRAAPAA
jgi:hypothetical protein